LQDDSCRVDTNEEDVADPETPGSVKSPNFPQEPMLFKPIDMS